MTAETSFEKPQFLDDLFSDSHRKKHEAIDLLCKESLTDSELEMVAEAIYETTFLRVFYMNYSHCSGKNGSSVQGCRLDHEEIKNEAMSYFDSYHRRVKHRPIDSDVRKLAAPAKGFALKKLWEYYKEDEICKMVGLPKNPTREEVSRVFEEYKAEIGVYMQFLKSYLATILSRPKL